MSDRKKRKWTNEDLIAELKLALKCAQVCNNQEVLWGKKSPFAKKIDELLRAKVKS